MAGGGHLQLGAMGVQAQRETLGEITDAGRQLEEAVASTVNLDLSVFLLLLRVHPISVPIPKLVSKVAVVEGTRSSRGPLLLGRSAGPGCMS